MAATRKKRKAVTTVITRAVRRAAKTARKEGEETSHERSKGCRGRRIKGRRGGQGGESAPSFIIDCTTNKQEREPHNELRAKTATFWQTYTYKKRLENDPRMQ